jgi:ribosomal protein S18 acetylase RimI-like enzyme
MQATIRAAKAHDIPRLAELWHEKMVLQQQFDPRYRLMPDSSERWSGAMAEWLNNPLCAVFVAEADNTLFGYSIGWIRDTLPGLLPEREGVITDLCIDPHSGQHSLGRKLVYPLHQWFQAQTITHIVAQVPHRSPVEQAFWRGMGATAWLELMWIKL